MLGSVCLCDVVREVAPFEVQVFPQVLQVHLQLWYLGL